MSRISIVLALASLLAALSGNAAGTGTSPYVGEETRLAKSLSPEDIDELRQGRGWGLAKAAELNGLPGPFHLLELKHRIPLAPEQVDAVTAIHERMRAAAIAEGERFIAAEQALDNAFGAGTVTEESLQAMLTDIERSRARLRFIHLSAHLSTPKLLTQVQIARYAKLRGYHAYRGGTAHEGHGPQRH